jgi:hypothetical protein
MLSENQTSLRIVKLGARNRSKLAERNEGEVEVRGGGPSQNVTFQLDKRIDIPASGLLHRVFLSTTNHRTWLDGIIGNHGPGL